MTFENTQPEVENTQPEVDEQAEKSEYEPPKVRYKFNKEELEEEFDPNTYQKGKNYDKVLDRLKAYESDEAIKTLDEIAKTYGESRTELMKRWKSELDEKQAQEYAESKSPEELAKELLQTRSENALTKSELEQLRQLQELDNQISALKKQYPDVNEDSIPDEVLELCKEKGVDLVTAYQAHQVKIYEEKVKELEKKLNADTVNEENKNTSMGSVKSQGDAAPVDITDESIAKMTPQERKKYHKKIWNYLTGK